MTRIDWVSGFQTWLVFSTEKTEYYIKNKEWGKFPKGRFIFNGDRL